MIHTTTTPSVQQAVREDLNGRVLKLPAAVLGHECCSREVKGFQGHNDVHIVVHTEAHMIVHFVGNWWRESVNGITYFYKKVSEGGERLICYCCGETPRALCFL